MHIGVSSFGCYVYNMRIIFQVLCTATAEALAMGKIVIIPRIPANEFFFQFRNCRTYSSSSEFCAHLEVCLIFYT